MNNDPMDMFEEMDAMVARHFSRMDREFMAGSPQMYRYHIIVSNGDVPGNGDARGSPIARDTRKPVAEVHRIGDETKVITELPGVSGDAVRLEVNGSTLLIDAGDAENHYRTRAEIPGVDTATMTRSFRHGVLEVTFSNLPADAGVNAPAGE